MQQSLIFCDECGAANASQVTVCVACQQPLTISTTLPVSSLSPVTAVKPQPQTQSMRQISTEGPLQPGMLLEKRYRILEQIGSGGFGMVYKARDTQQADRMVAVKQIQLARLSSREMIQATDSYNRETTLQPFLRHRSLPRIYRHFTDTENWYLVLEYIHGETLEQMLQRVADGKLALNEALEIGLQLCDVLRYLHTEGLIFRDVKPANIMRTARGHIYLIDFGIARRYDARKFKDTMPLGSPGYAAPEQYGTLQSTQQTDIYGLGATLLTLLTGKDLVAGQLSEALTDPILPEKLRVLLATMLAKDPDQRPRDLRVVKYQLLQIQAALPEKRRRNIPRFAAGLLLGSLFHLSYLVLVLRYNAEWHASATTHGTYGDFSLLSFGVPCFSILLPVEFLAFLLLGLLQFRHPGKRWQGAGLIIGIILSLILVLELHLWPSL